MPDVISYVNCHNTSQLDDSVACGLLVVHTRGFVLIDHSGFPLVPHQTMPPLYTAYIDHAPLSSNSYMYTEVSVKSRITLHHTWYNVRKWC